MQTYIHQNPHFPAEPIASLFRLIASRNGLCLKVGAFTGVARGLRQTQTRSDGCLCQPVESGLGKNAHRHDMYLPKAASYSPDVV